MNKKSLTTLLLLLFLSLKVSAGTGTTFFYQYTVEAVETGMGKVYVSDDNTPPTEEQYLDYFGQTYSKSATAGIQTITTTAHLYAKPEPGYMFTHWNRVNGDTETTISYTKNTTDLVTTISNTTIDKPNKVLFKAYFAKTGIVYPVSSDETLGAVHIDIPTNTIGDVVTMTALPDHLCGRFLGWRHDDSPELITDNPYVLEVTESSAGTYTAVFEDKNVEEKGIYVMMENVGTQRILGVIGKTENTYSQDQRYFHNSMMLVPTTNENIHSLPSTVIRLTGKPTGSGGLSSVEMKCQGINTYEIGNRRFHIEKYLDDTYFVYEPIGDFPGYLRDYGSENGVEDYMEKVGEYHSPGLWNRWKYDNAYVWVFRLLDEEHLDENYFGAKPSAISQRDGKYYTTMYTSFPYRCMDGVKAYTVDQIMDGGIVNLKEISSGEVPSQTAVVLECNSTNPRYNRLLPILTEPEPIEGENLLKGEIWLNDENTDTATFRTAFNPETMRVFNEETGMFSSTNNKDPHLGDAPLEYLVNNTCYLDISGMENIPETLNITTGGRKRLLGDANDDKEVNVIDVMCVVNYILENPVPVFIFENADTHEDLEINVIDAMWIVNYILNN